MALAYLLLAAVALYPIFSVAIPPLVDYPNHLARLHIITSIDDVPVLSERYAVEWSIRPNLAMDAFVVALANWLPVAEALRLFVALALVLILGGSVALHRVLFGRIGLTPAAVFLVLYNHVLIFGFLNYLFGAGLYLLTFAGWIAAERWPAWRRLLLFSAASVVLFFAHLFAFGIYGLSVAAFELWRTRGSWEKPWQDLVRAWAVALGQFGIPAILWLASLTGGRNLYTDYGGFKSKLLALLSPTWCYGEPLDRVIFLFLGFLLIRGLFSGRLKVAAELRYPLIVLLLAAIVMPNWLIGVWGVDFRLPFVLVCLLAAGTHIELRDVRVGLVLATIGLALFGTRVWTMADRWQGYDAQFAEFRRASHVIDTGANLLVAQRDRERTSDMPYWHMAALAVIERSVFLPFLFTDPTAQPLRVTKAYEALDTPFGSPLIPEMLRNGADPAISARLARIHLATGHRIFWANWPENFDYVLYVHFGEDENPMPALLRRVYTGSFFAIYKVLRD